MLKNNKETLATSHPVEWYGCYKYNTNIWTPESFCHPAKMSPALCFRIIDHLTELGILQPSGVITDPMCGVGTTLLCGAIRGFKAIGVELESKFKLLAEANKLNLEKQLGHSVDMTIIQGDARHLSQLLSEQGVVAISSPLFLNSGLTKDKNFISKIEQQVRNGSRFQGGSDGNYGQSPGQIGNLTEGTVILSSPPYGNMSTEQKPFSERTDRTAKFFRQSRPNTYDTTGVASAGHGYGQGPQNIGNLSDENSDKTEQGESYWEAVRQVYTECLKIADVMVLVTKDPTRLKKLYPLGRLTAELLESIGWQIICQHKAMLYSIQEQKGLFEDKKLYKGRLSFFKRLSLKKGGMAADHEDVLIAINPHSTRNSITAISSPPYADSLTSNSRHGNSGIAARDPKIGDLGRYGVTPGQIGNMPEGRVIISSPPYSNITVRNVEKSVGKAWQEEGRGAHENPTGYGEAQGQIGNMKE